MRRRLYFAITGGIIVLITAVVILGQSDKYSYSGTITEADTAITLGAISQLKHLSVEKRGDTWIRYNVSHDASGLYIPNGTVTVQVEHGQIKISGAKANRLLISDILRLK